MRPFSELTPEAQAELEEFGLYLRLKTEAKRQGKTLPPYDTWKHQHRHEKHMARTNGWLLAGEPCND